MYILNITKYTLNNIFNKYYIIYYVLLKYVIYYVLLKPFDQLNHIFHIFYYLKNIL